MKRTSWTGCLTIIATLAGTAGASDAPTCAQWQAQKLTAETCVCGSQVRRGDDRAKQCVENSSAMFSDSQAGLGSETTSAAAQRLRAAVSGIDGASFDTGSLPDAPSSAVAAKERKFGIKSVTVDGGSISGADGSGGKNGSIAVEIYRQKTKAGTLSAEAEYGRYTMSGIAINDVKNLGQIGKLPDGTPIDGTAIITGRSPAVTYVPLGSFKDYVPMPKALHRLHPYAVAELGMSRLSSTNAVIDTKIVEKVGGQTIGTQDLGTSLEPTGEGINHLGGGFGGGAKIDLTKDGRLAVDTQYLDAPTGYRVVKSGVTYTFGHKKAKAKRKVQDGQ